MDAFLKDLAEILGLCFTTLAKAMALYGSEELNSHSRMANFELWGYNLTLALGKDGNSFLEAYEENQRVANDFAVTSDPLAEAIIALMKNTNSYEGGATEIFRKLTILADCEKINVKGNGFPKSPNTLGKKLKEMKSNLEDIGIKYDTIPSKNHTTKIVFEKMPTD